jgi:predicted nucleic acid-binding protein
MFLFQKKRKKYMPSVYIKTSILSYLTARPSGDVRAAAWQQLTGQWWDECRQNYELFTSELVVVEASTGSPDSAQRRLEALKGIDELLVDSEVERLADRLIQGGALPESAPADALHIALAAIHRIDYLLTWNCRHIDNAKTKPIIREICSKEGYICPEICTPLEFLGEESNNVQR